MKRTTLTTAVVAALAVGAAGAQAQPTTGSTTTSRPGYVSTTRTVTATATVAAIDMATRQVTLRRADGTTFDIVAGEEVRNLAQLRVGDAVTIEYVDALALELKKGGTGLPASRSDVAAATRAELGARPGAGMIKETTIVADVVRVDAAAQNVTLRGPRGNLVVLPVRDPEQFRRIAVGDQIEATYAEAVAVSVKPVEPPPAAAAPVPRPKPFSAFLFFWGPSLDADFTVADPRNGNPIRISTDASFSDIWNNLDSAFMIYGDWTSDKWSVFGDYTYTRLSPSANLEAGRGYSSVDTTLKTQFGQIAVGYGVWGDRNAGIQLYAGARYYNLNNSATLHTPNNEFGTGGSDEWWDAIGGVRGRMQFAPRWVGVAQVDYGAGGSQHSWQAWGYVGYEFDWGSIGAGWRYLNFSRNHGNTNTDESFNGPLLGLVLRF